MRACSCGSTIAAQLRRHTRAHIFNCGRGSYNNYELGTAQRSRLQSKREKATPCLRSLSALRSFQRWAKPVCHQQYYFTTIRSLFSLVLKCALLTAEIVSLIFSTFIKLEPQSQPDLIVQVYLSWRLICVLNCEQQSFQVWLTVHVYVRSTLAGPCPIQ